MRGHERTIWQAQGECSEITSMHKPNQDSETIREREQTQV